MMSSIHYSGACHECRSKRRNKNDKHFPDLAAGVEDMKLSSNIQRQVEKTGERS
jgi:hypothetical protein